VVSITSSELVMTNKDGKEHSHTLTADTKVSLDGKVCKSEDLKAGMKIRVTTKANDAKIATRIEAIDKNESFASTQDGKVVSIASGKLVMTNKAGKECSFVVADDVTVTLDGKASKLEDLKAGMRIRVTTLKSDQGVATGIEAIDKNAEFARRS